MGTIGIIVGAVGGGLLVGGIVTAMFISNNLARKSVLRSPRPDMVQQMPSFIPVPQPILAPEEESVVFQEPTRMMARTVSITPMTNQKTPKFTGGSGRNVFTPIQVRSPFEAGASARYLQTTNSTT